MVLVICLELVAFTAYWTARRWSARLLAAVAGLIVLLQSMTLVNMGMWYNVASVALALLFLIGLARFLERPTAGRWIFACLMLTLATYCHPLGAIMGCTCWLGAFAHEAVHRPRHGRAGMLAALLFIPMTGMLLAAPQLLPLLEGSTASPKGAIASSALTVRPFQPGARDLVKLAALLASLPAMRYMWKYDKLYLFMFVSALLGAAALHVQLPAWLPVGTPFRWGLVEYAERFEGLEHAINLVDDSLGGLAGRMVVRPRTRRLGGLGRVAGPGPARADPPLGRAPLNPRHIPLFK